MERILNPMRIRGEGEVFVKIEYNEEEEKLSISGVIGPKYNGDCSGCGQINQSFETWISHEDIEYKEDWNRDLWEIFLMVWNKYHLNDMQAACEHQRNLWNIDKKVTLYTYRLKTDVFMEQGAIQKKINEQLRTGKTVKLTEEEQFLLNLEFSITTPEACLSPKVADYYKLKTKEEKYINWVREEEHPEGILSRKCPVCGYKYGSKWIKKEVPRSILAFLRGLPETKVKPAWI